MVNVVGELVIQNGCPSCSANTFCVESTEKSSTTEVATGTIDVTNWDSEFNFADLCKDDDDDACMAMDGGNVYLAFTIFAIIFNLFTLCLIAPRMSMRICDMRICVYNIIYSVLQRQ